MANQSVNLPSRMLMLRLASCRVVLWALDTFGPELVGNLRGSSDRVLSRAIPRIVDPLMKMLAVVLRGARDQLIASDRALRDQTARTSGFRRLRDAAFKALGGHWQGLRDTVRGTYGAAAVEDLGFSLRMPQQPGILFEQSEHLAARLGAPDVALPASRYENLDLDLTALSDGMRPLVVRLGEALEEVGREERQSEAMKLAKDSALKAYDRKFLWVARTAESLFYLADMPEVAKRVRPSLRRRGLTTELAASAPETVLEAGQAEPAQAEPGGGAPEASPAAEGE